MDGTTISEDDDLTIDDEYTTGGATATETIFTGDIGEIDYLDETNAYCESQLNEIDVITPNNLTYTDKTYLNVLIDLINGLCSVVTLPDAGASIGKFFGTGTWDFNADAGSDPDDWTVVDNPADSLIYVEDIPLGWMPSGHKQFVVMRSWLSDACYMYRAFSATHTNGTVEFYLSTEDDVSGGTVYGNIYFRDGTPTNAIDLKLVENLSSQDATLQYDDGGGYDNIATFALGTWYHIRIDFECGAGAYKGLAADTFDMYIDGVSVVSDGGFKNAVANINDLYYYFVGSSASSYDHMMVDSIGLSWDGDYYIGKNLNYDQTFFDYPTSTIEYPAQEWIFDGEKSIRKLLDEYADSIGGHWYFDNEDKIYCNDCSTDSGFDITTSTDLIYITGQKQIKQIDQVILLGGWTSAGIRLKVTSGAGNNVFRDTYAHVTDTNILTEIADNILTNKQLHPVTLSVSILDAVKGMFQVGETITIGASLIFSDTTKAVPTGQYIIRQCVFNQLTKVCEMILDDGIVFEGNKSLGEENSELIRQNRDDIEDDTAYGSSWNGDTIPPSKNAVYDKLESHGLLASKKITIALSMMPLSSAYFGGNITINAVGEYVGAALWLDDMIDATQDITFTWFFQAGQTDAALSMKKYGDAAKTDNTEGISWNLDNASVHSIAIVSGKLGKYTYTFANADIEEGDQLFNIFMLNEAARSLTVNGCQATFYLK